MKGLTPYERFPRGQTKRARGQGPPTGGRPLRVARSGSPARGWNPPRRRPPPKEPETQGKKDTL